MDVSSRRNRATALPEGRSDASEIAATVAAFRAQRRLRHPGTREAAELLARNETDAAGTLVAKFLERLPRDAGALNLLGEIASRNRDYATAEAVLAKCLDASPDFALARFNYAFALHNRNRLPAALEQLDRILWNDPKNFLALDLKSVVLAIMGRHSDSMSCRKQLVDDYPCDPEMWIKYGSALRSLAMLDDSISAYHKAIELQPSSAAWWDLADLKTYRFSEAEIVAIRAQLARPDLSSRERIYLHFALGKALGDCKQFHASFENYARANALKRALVEYDPESLSRHVAHCKANFTAEFFESRKGWGAVGCDPIFIVGMQRAGSTLIEQILASHSAVEATAELPDISLLAERIGTNITPAAGYPDGLREIDKAEFERYGTQYLESTRFRRPAGRSHFVDKMPYNSLHLALIQLILPNSKIIDVRRHPLACCFSNYSIHFESGPLFSHRLGELGRAYADYVELMAHFDAVLPGRIHRVFYEDLVRNPESEMRRLFDYLQLPFEEACLRFHQTDRTMISVSAEQVRRPITSGAIDYWRHYEPWLGPLKAALGPVLDLYPAVPEFHS